MRKPVLMMIIDRIPKYLQEALALGANPNVQTYERKVIIRLYCDSGEKEMADDFYYETPLMTAVSDADNVKILLDHGADVNRYTSEGVTALSLAVQGGYLMSVKLLVDAGANVNWVDDKNRSILSFAVNAEIKKYLISKGAKMNPPSTRQPKPKREKPTCDDDRGSKGSRQNRILL